MQGHGFDPWSGNPPGWEMWPKKWILKNLWKRNHPGEHVIVNQDEWTWGGHYKNSSKGRPRLGAQKAFWARGDRADPKEAELTKNQKSRHSRQRELHVQRPCGGKEPPNPAIVHNNPYPSVNFELEGSLLSISTGTTIFQDSIISHLVYCNGQLTTLPYPAQTIFHITTSNIFNINQIMSLCLKSFNSFSFHPE